LTHKKTIINIIFKLPLVIRSINIFVVSLLNRFRTSKGHLGLAQFIQNIPGGKVDILSGYSIGDCKQNNVYMHVSYSERFLRQRCGC
jgi:hypothetical protein